jgi:hypothetical protein
MNVFNCSFYAYGYDIGSDEGLVTLYSGDDEQEAIRLAKEGLATCTHTVAGRSRCRSNLASFTRPIITPPTKTLDDVKYVDSSKAIIFRPLE